MRWREALTTGLIGLVLTYSAQAAATRRTAQHAGRTAQHAAQQKAAKKQTHPAYTSADYEYTPPHTPLRFAVYDEKYLNMRWANATTLYHRLFSDPSKRPESTSIPELDDIVWKERWLVASTPSNEALFFNDDTGNVMTRLTLKPGSRAYSIWSSAKDPESRRAVTAQVAHSALRAIAAEWGRQPERVSFHVGNADMMVEALKRISPNESYYEEVFDAEGEDKRLPAAIVIQESGARNAISRDKDGKPLARGHFQMLDDVARSYGLIITESWNESDNPILQSKAAAAHFRKAAYPTGDPFTMIIVYHTGTINWQKMGGLALYRNPEFIKRGAEALAQIDGHGAQADNTDDLSEVSQQQELIREMRAQEKSFIRQVLPWVYRRGYKDPINTVKFSRFQTASGHYLPQVLAKMSAINYGALKAERPFEGELVTIHYTGEKRLNVNSVMGFFASKQQLTEMNEQIKQLYTTRTIPAPGKAISKGAKGKKARPAAKKRTVTVQQPTEIPEGAHLFLPLNSAQRFLNQYHDIISANITVERYEGGRISPPLPRGSWTEIDKKYARLAKRRAVGGYQAVKQEEIVSLKKQCDAEYKGNLEQHIPPRPELWRTCSTLAFDASIYDHTGMTVYNAVMRGEKPPVITTSKGSNTKSASRATVHGKRAPARSSSKAQKPKKTGTQHKQ